MDTKNFSFFFAKDNLTIDHFGQSNEIILTHTGNSIDLSVGCQASFMSRFHEVAVAKK